MRSQARLVVVIAMVLFVRPSIGAGISVNFGDGRADGFFPVEGVAGFVPLDNWNNILDEGRDGVDPPVLIDDTGADTSASISWIANTWRTQINETLSDNHTLFRAYIDATPDQDLELEISGIPYDSYDLYIYHLTNGANNSRPNRKMSVSLDDGATKVFTSDLDPLHEFDGFILDMHSTIEAAEETNGGNYIVFSELTDPDLSILAVVEIGDLPDGVPRASISGFQLVPSSAQSQLMAGDADMDFDFDQLDLVKVQIAARYLTGQLATWGAGDWNGAPGGEPGNPPTGNGQFDQLDIIAALAPGHYLTGPYATIKPDGQQHDGQTSIGYDANTGEVWVDAPAGIELTSINIDSATSIFTGEPAQNLGGSFDNAAANNIFKATFGSSFGSLSFGKVARSGLSETSIQDELTVVGSLAGGGDLGEVDLIYVREPASALLLCLGLVMGLWRFGRASG